MSLPCLVLGGGTGTRMRPATNVIPKPLLPVAGEPFVFHQLRWLASHDVTEVVYSIGYLGQMIRDALSGADLFGCSVQFVDEGPTLLGTGGAVRLAVDQKAVDGEFLVLYGDSYLDVDVGAVADAFAACGAEALMTVYRNDGAWDTSNVVFDGARVVRYDKHEPDPAAAGMRHIDYGLSILQRDTVTALIARNRPSDLAEVFHLLSVDGRLAGFEADHRFYEIGSPAGLDDLERHLATMLCDNDDAPQ